MCTMLNLSAQDGISLRIIGEFGSSHYLVQNGLEVKSTGVDGYGWGRSKSAAIQEERY